MRIDSEKLVELASFQVFVPHQSSQSLLDNSNSILIALGLVTIIGVIIVLAVKEKVK